MEAVKPPAVTVAIPTHNRAGLLREAIDSVLQQTFQDFEVLVLDDASTDDTPMVVDSYTDPRIRRIRHSVNVGMKANWNRGVELADGEFVTLLHDDDRWDPRFLERAMVMMKQNPELGFVYSAPAGISGLSKRDRIYSPLDALDHLRKRNEVGVEAVLVRRDALIAVGRFRDRWPFSMDWDAWLRIAARHPVGFLAESLGYNGAGAEGRLTSRMEETPLAIARDRYGMLRTTIPELPLPDESRKRLLKGAMRSLAQTQLVDAWDWAARGHRKRARQEAKFAFEIDRRVALRAPLLVAATYLGLLLPPSLVRRLDRFRAAARRLLRPD